MPWMSPLFPRGPIDLGARAAALPLDNSLPDLAGLALDSYSRPFTGTRVVLSLGGQGVASGRCVLHHKPAIVSCGRHAKPEMQGPPTYFTPDWDAARRSVETLAGLQADVLAPSHGLTMHGKAATEALNLLARGFIHIATPKHGHYVDEARGNGGSDAGG